MFGVTDGISYWCSLLWAILGHRKYENAFRIYLLKKKFKKSYSPMIMSI